MKKRIAILSVFTVLLLIASSADAHGRRDRGGSHRSRVGVVITPTYRAYDRYYYAPVPVYVAPPVYVPSQASGASTLVHENGLLDYLVEKPVGFAVRLVLGRNRPVCAPDDVGCHGQVGSKSGHYDGRVATAQATEEAQYDTAYKKAAPPDRQSNDYQEGSLDRGEDSEGAWDLSIDPKELESLKRYFSAINATQAEEDAFWNGIDMIKGEDQIGTLSQREIELLRGLREKLAVRVRDLSELDALIEFASRVANR